MRVLRGQKICFQEVLFQRNFPSTPSFFLFNCQAISYFLKGNVQMCLARHLFIALSAFHFSYYISWKNHNRSLN